MRDYYASVVPLYLSHKEGGRLGRNPVDDKAHPHMNID